MRGTDVCNGGLARSARLRAVPARSNGKPRARPGDQPEAMR